jgi:mono/diheme cytochrome c family protein
MARARVSIGLAAVLCAGAAPAAAASGAEVYAARCAVCHQPDGSGAPGFIPPLQGTLGNFLRVDGGRRYLAMVVTNGLAGPIQVSGRPYNSNMPAFGPQLRRTQIAAVLNHVLTEVAGTSTPGDFAPYTAGEVADLAGPGGAGAQATRALRRTLLERLQAKGLTR